MSQQSFADLGVSRAVAGALAERGITEPFAIQQLVIADILAGHDVLAKSPTGSGKTIAFGAPIADRIEAGDRRPAALILAPTRELASQIVDDLRPLAHARALRIASVYGGVGIVKQAREAARAHIVVATPGRLEDLLQRGDLTLDRVRILVLDEADRMLDMGFKPGRRPHRGPVPGQAPDAVLLRHARRRGRPRGQELHARRPPPRARARRSAARPRPSTASSPSSATRASRRCWASCAATATSRSSSCAPSAASTGWSSA